MTPTERAHAWQRHMTDWQASGASGSAYCKQQSLVYHQFVYWRRRLTSGKDYPKQAPDSRGLFLQLPASVLMLATLMA